MREILFRGKDLFGEWREGYYVKTRWKWNWHKHGMHRDWLISSAISNGGWFNVVGRHAVVADTVGQYTGLTDKNGKKIFEGDILRNEKGICYGGCYAAVVKYNCGEFLGEGFVNFWAVDFCVLEVIGNIYDDPELMSEVLG